MSDHYVNVIEIGEVRPHDNADRLEIVPIGGWQAVVKKGDFAPESRAVYIEPDYVVPTDRPEFAFLAKDGRTVHRLKAVRLRGVLSYGLLIPVPEDLASRAVGDDVMTDLGITRYEPAMKFATSDELDPENAPSVYAPKFDLESLQRYSRLLVDGEEVIVTEKIHGANARFCFLDGVFYLGSRTRWLKPEADTPWARAAATDDRIEAWCQRNPGVILYGEIYGSVQSLKYGCAPGEIKFAAFAASNGGDWINTKVLHEDIQLPTVPVLYEGPWEPNTLLPMAEYDSTVPGTPPGQIREGLVIVPVQERRDMRLGRVALKHVSNRYWESNA